MTYLGLSTKVYLENKRGTGGASKRYFYRSYDYFEIIYEDIVPG
jgi:hypothetical protein